MPAIIGKPVRSMSNPGAAPATVIDRSPAAGPRNSHWVNREGARSGIESPETGLTDSTGVAEGSTVKRRLPFALVPALLKSHPTF